eukprot:5276304-Amphidinium_carterae.1
MAVESLARFLNVVEAAGQWPQDIREVMYLQRPRDVGERRPIALLPQVYRLWRALCRHDVREWRARCTGRGEVPVGRGALDETVAFETELTTASDTPQAGIFLNFSKCYERVPVATLEALWKAGMLLMRSMLP